MWITCPRPLLAAAALLTACGAPTPNRSIIALTPAPHSDAAFRDGVGVRGRIVIGETFLRSVALDSAAIQLTPVGPGQPVSGRSDSTGTFTLGAVPAGVYTITVWVPRDTVMVAKTVTARLRPVELTIPAGGGRLELVFLARFLPGSARLVTAVDLIEPPPS